MKADEESWWENLTDELERGAKMGNSTVLFRKIKNVSWKRSNVSDVVLDANGEIIEKRAE